MLYFLFVVPVVASILFVLCRIGGQAAKPRWYSRKNGIAYIPPKDRPEPAAIDTAWLVRAFAARKDVK